MNGAKSFTMNGSVKVAVKPALADIRLTSYNKSVYEPSEVPLLRLLTTLPLIRTNACLPA